MESNECPATHPAAGELDERALVAAATGGDGDAFTRLVECHLDRIYCLALRVLDDPSDAEDAVQEIFLRAYRGLPGFHATAGFGTWVYRIAVNHCRDQLRRRTARAQIVSIAYAARLWADERYTVDPERVAMTMEDHDMLERALAKLPAMYRLTVLLHDVEGVPIREVAALTATPLPTAKSRLRRARMALVTLLDEDGQHKRPDTYGRAQSQPEQGGAQ
jgi:RNA polymerase sigma-70 factor (ECF subfamily)